MTNEDLRIANNLKEDIEHLEKKRKQVFDFDEILKKRKPTESEANLFLNSMLSVINALQNIKKEQFEKL